MIKSMTGYGKASAEYAGNALTVEIRSLNSKQAELNLRIFGKYKARESEIRSELTRKLERGKIDFILAVENPAAVSNCNINKPAVHKYYKELEALSRELNQPMPPDILPAILRLPDALISDNSEIEDKEWQQISAIINTAIDELNTFRLKEGKVLEKDISNRIQMIENLLKSVDSFEKERMITIKNRINKNLAEFVENEKIDRNRFEQELIYYLEKIDFTEEKVRLQKHCEYFYDTLAEKEPNGKKLGFICQEIGREINTIGSKANDVSIQQIVVQMKDELEKVKEQLLNIL